MPMKLHKRRGCVGYGIDRTHHACNCISLAVIYLSDSCEHLYCHDHCL